MWGLAFIRVEDFGTVQFMFEERKYLRIWIEAERADQSIDALDGRQHDQQMNDFIIKAQVHMCIMILFHRQKLWTQHSKTTRTYFRYCLSSTERMQA